MSIDVQLLSSSTQDTPKIALITFDNEKSLNAQNTDMVITIKKQLTLWQKDDNIAIIVMRGAGEKAFCAGGDIRSLYHATGTPDNHHQKINADIARFFENEYGLIYQLHTYPKPIVAWGTGIVMGGGLGLLAGSSHKIITDSTLMAMPEVSIGLFPDAGGSYFLNRMMGKVGLFLGLTGARFSGSDAYYLGLADYALPKENWDKLLSALQNTAWTTCPQQNHALTSQALNAQHTPSLVQHSQILASLADIQTLMNAGDLLAVDKALQHYQGDSNFIKTALPAYQAGCPTTKALTWAIYHKVSTWSLKQILALELNTAIACCRFGDFREGVRALLIDKDKSPKWRYRLDNLPAEYIKQHFASPYQGAHPFD